MINHQIIRDADEAAAFVSRLQILDPYFTYDIGLGVSWPLWVVWSTYPVGDGGTEIEINYFTIGELHAIQNEMRNPHVRP